MKKTDTFHIFIQEFINHKAIYSEVLNKLK